MVSSIQVFTKNIASGFSFSHACYISFVVILDFTILITFGNQKVHKSILTGSCSYIFVNSFLLAFAKVKVNDPLRSPMVTICTNSVRVQKLRIPTQCTYVNFTNPRKRQTLFPYTLLLYWFLGVVYKVKKKRTYVKTLFVRLRSITSN